MNFKLIEIIERTSETSFDKVISILKSETSKRFQLFSDRIMRGQINNGHIIAVINPPLGLADPFKSNLNGVVLNENGKTKILLKIYPSWLIIGFGIIWYVLLLFMIIRLSYKDITDSLKSIGLILIYGFVPYGLCKLKLNWDTRRLKYRIDKIVKNSA
jgi:hypothetical protein